MAVPPILDNKHPSAPSVFVPAALMREARRQKKIKETTVPTVCILDPTATSSAICAELGVPSRPQAGHVITPNWMFSPSPDGRSASLDGQSALPSRFWWSSGQIVASGPPPYFIIIYRALRDEGTSYHYIPPSEYASACPQLLAAAVAAVTRDGPRAICGSTWTTDAPFRETSKAIQAAVDKGILAVEMEAAALYAFATATGCKVLCLAHVTNMMAQSGADFEKGENDGRVDALVVLGSIVGALAEG